MASAANIQGEEAMPNIHTPKAADVIVVGAGATGGTAAKVLSERGLEVVLFDRGPWLKPKDYSGDEIKYINRNFLWPDPKLKPRTVRADENSKAELFPFSPLPQLVGGGTTHWAGWLPRPLPSDFMLKTLHGDVQGASLADWPISYDDLEPFLTKVEWEFGCTGLDGADKYAPHRSRPYPSAPLPPTKFAKVFYDACKKMDINGFPLPHAMVTNAHKGRVANNYTGFWNQYGDPSGTRSNAATTFIPEALATGKCELRPDSYCVRVLTNAEGEANGVVYLDEEGAEHCQHAKLVILCLGAIESARLLLLSKSPRHPHGLANGSGLLGKNATFHEYLYAVGLFDRELHGPLSGFAGNYISGGTMQFYETDEKRGHIGGCIISAAQTGQPINWNFPGRPTWGDAAKSADSDFFNYAMKIGLILHDMPVESNRVDLDPDVLDAWGLPAARITHKPHHNDVAMARWQVDKNAEILDTAGASKILPVYLEKSTGNTCHQHGTARMGFDDKTSVLNEWCEAHDVPNLFVLDGSSFPTALGVNPTLAMMANAWRCSEYIADHHVKGHKHRLDHNRHHAQAHA
jgi:choline dehydrogenase-like flavoprotein